MPSLEDDDLDLPNLFAPVQGARKLALAVSGGPDSLALLLLAHEWSRSAAVELVAYSVDHGLRPAAAAEVAMVLAQAARLGLPARGLRWEGNKPETGIQAAARKARYRMMAEAMAADGAEYLMTAHHLGDQAETVLMRLAHGSGIEGLRGMDRFATVEGCKIFRPLLAVEPEALAEIVAQAGLTPAHDPSNEDRHYERVRWRQMMPALAELGLDLRRMGTFAARMAEADAYIAAEAELAFTALVHVGPDGGAEMPQAAYGSVAPILAVRLLGRVLRLVGGDRKPHALATVESLSEKLRLRQPLKATTLHGCVISSDGIMVSVRPEGARRSRPLVTAS
jgi:tRNA(Ile)-lysidine synthase